MRVISILALLVVFPSCTVTRTVGIDGSRPSIGFENADAARMFYEAVLDEQFPSGTGRSLTFTLAPLDIERENVRDSAVILSEAVSRTDHDGNGTISVSEARAFASSVVR